MKVSFHTFGCKLNQAETDELKKDLVKLGFSVVPIEHGENIAIVRACAVTSGASQSTRAMIRRLKRSGAYVIAVGCLENKNIAEIDFVARNNEEVIKHVIARSGATKQSLKLGIASSPRPCNGAPRNDSKDRTRAFIKIQTGCNFNCAYCIVPSFRGRAQSVPAEKIIAKIKSAEKDGYLEIVLTGVNICQYHDGATNLTALLKKILEETKIPRLRLGSLDPRLISNRLIHLYSQSPRLLPHWHLSLQSGSDITLKKMNRLYTAKKYLEIVNKLRKSNPLFSFTTDIIIGFPGEDEEDFAATCALVKKIQFGKVHIFPFSPRPNTQAAKMPDQVSDKIKTSRAEKLKTIADQATKEFARQFIGRGSAVLFEHKKSSAWWGYTPEYLRVKSKSAKNLKNKIVNIEINHKLSERFNRLGNLSLFFY